MHATALTVSLLTWALPLQAGSDPAEPESPSARRPPTTERPLQSDWMRLGSGEWLTGEFDGLRTGQIEFSSLRVGSRSWSFADVTDLYLHRLNTFVFEGGTSIVGIGRIDETRLTVETLRGERTFPRESILRIVAADESEIQHWDFRLRLGGNGRIGNGSQIQGNANLRLRRRGTLTRFVLAGDFNIGFVPTDTTQPGELSDLTLNVFNTQFDSNFDWYFSKRFFWTVFTGFVRTDRFQNLLARFQPGSQVGYDLLLGTPVRLSVGLGASYQYAAYESAFEDGREVDRLRNNVGPSFSAKLLWSIASNVSFTLRNASFIGAVDPGLSTIDTNGALAVKLTRNLDFSFDVTHRFQPDPVEPDATESIAESDLDLRFSLGVTFD